MTPQPLVEWLTALLRDRYAAGRVTLTAARHGLNPVFRVEREQAPTWYVRSDRRVPRIARALLYLEERGAAAPRLVTARDGAPYVEDAGRQALVMTAVEGQAPPLTPAAMEKVGAALGNLHALGPVATIPPVLSGGIELPAIERAGMQPRGELAAARSWLDQARDHLPPQRQPHFDALASACDAMDLCENLPKVFIHADAHYNNTILSPSGETVYVDYDSAGPGPAVIDLGFLLLNADGGPIVSPPAAPDPRRVEALLRGYCTYVAPSDDDLSRLADAIRFRPLVYACARLKSDVVHGRPPDAWPLERLRAAGDLAARAIAAIRARPRP